ncbi:hypothetical protein Pmar_PMAR010398 [Perkinsus marinus ATCC 50983]|uniref:Uncharacterized protein n=1 Tax=Perkinsus marinus (strain ATCC 50983 / TXsc) TaxID=423536 RepID=C5LN20_PERM5|nr:hypothetical protein Pmar_PMAR010398 [Perkinsus marinus ATCC 50983]EER01873.1 hypothetical protein Pmar_PMAR010398 [Perkinsus marinus ATCC 50983]|eukprot:XP_002769155.1 hypothetical protein Pmar_PMAR010398 [Perkinsus marinus ATCC 50983]
MRILVGLIIAIAVNAILNSKPSGNYCGYPVITPRGKGFIPINIADSHKFNIYAEWTPFFGCKSAGIEYYVPYSYEDSTQNMTVTDFKKAAGSDHQNRCSHETL